MQNITEIFKNLFRILSKRIQWIFKKLHGMCKKCRSVFPSREYIASEVGCSVRTVARALRLFEMNGWIVIKKRPYQSNVYFMDESLIALDLDNPKTFMREEIKNVPQNGTVLEVSIRKEIDTYKKDVPKSKDVHHCLKIQGLEVQDREVISYKYSEVACQEALKDAKWYTKIGKQINNLAAFITSRCKYYSSEKALN